MMAICICFKSNMRLFSYLVFLTIYLINHINVSQGAFETNLYNQKCGSIQVPFPFYLNSYSSPQVVSKAFGLSCVMQQTSQVLYLSIGVQKYRVVRFFTDGVLVDYLVNTSFLDSSCTSRYINLDAFGFEGNDYFGISSDNVVGLYGCQDSSLCKSQQLPLPHQQNETCAGSGSPCTYPLSDGGRLQLGADRGFSVFSQFGCKDFSCWVVVPPSNTSVDTRMRGVKLEWAIPRNLSMAQCSPNAYIINATSVPLGIRCQCPIGLVGDAFAHGFGCFKSCLKDGREAYGKDCFTVGIYHTRKVKVLVGVVSCALCLAFLTAIFCLLNRRTNKSSIPIPNKGDNSSAGKSTKTRLFSYDELEEATKGFDDSQKLVEGSKGALYAGVLGDGLHVAIHKLQKSAKNQKSYLIEEKESVSQSVMVLSTVQHKNLAHILGYCIDSPPLVVYEYPSYGTLEKHLLPSRNDDTSAGAGVGLDWFKRLKVASETASLLSFLQHKICPPVIHQDLHPGFIFLDSDFSVKLAGFTPSGGYLSDTSKNNNSNHAEEEDIQQFCTSDDVYSIGLLLVDLISGLGEKRSSPTVALGKIRSGKVAEIVDPLIYYDEHREEIEIVADLATRCLLFGNKLGMINVAKELTYLVHLKQPTIGTSNSNSNSNATTSSLLGSTPSSSSSRIGQIELEETFSNSSLLQMISMSPDSIYAPHFSV